MLEKALKRLQKYQRGARNAEKANIYEARFVFKPTFIYRKHSKNCSKHDIFTITYLNVNRSESLYAH